MLELMAKLPEYASTLLEVLGGLVLVASAVSRLTGTLKDDALVAKADSFLSKVLSFLPTLGLNTNTKRMQELLDRMNGKEKPAPEVKK